MPQKEGQGKTMAVNNAQNSNELRQLTSPDIRQQSPSIYLQPFKGRCKSPKC